MAVEQVHGFRAMRATLAESYEPVGVDLLQGWVEVVAGEAAEVGVGVLQRARERLMVACRFSKLKWRSARAP